MLETKIKAKNEDEVRNRLMRQWEMVTNGCTSNKSEPKGRIWLSWDPYMFDVEIINRAYQCIHCKVRTVDNKLGCFVTFVYAAMTKRERNLAWNDLANIAKKCERPGLY